LISKKLDRPRILPGVTTGVVTGCGKLFVTVNRHPDTNDIVEITAKLGKAGGCSVVQNEALCSMATLALSYGAPIEEIIREFIGHRCPSACVIPEEILSCPDGIGKVLRRHYNNARS
jgi:ribonucleoside-diphosphate reductase alpha chain